MEIDYAVLMQLALDVSKKFDKNLKCTSEESAKHIVLAMRIVRDTIAYLESLK